MVQNQALTGEDDVGTITFPLCQGMGFVTGIYKDLTPLFNSEHAIWAFEELAMPDATPATKKYRIQWRNYQEWLVYVTPLIPGITDPSFDFPKFKVVEYKHPLGHDDQRIEATGKFTGAIQLAHLPFASNSEYVAHHDSAAGLWCTGVDLTGELNGDAAKLAFDFQTARNKEKELLMYGFSHHVETLVSGNRVGPQLRSTTKGVMIGYFGTRWEMEEPSLAGDITMYPWTYSEGVPVFSDKLREKVIKAAEYELADHQLKTEADDPSIYWAGKFTTSRAQAVLALEGVLGHDHPLFLAALGHLKDAFARLATNRRRFPLLYDKTWGGIVNSLALKDMGEDYGNLAYNDHHLHYGYVVFVGAVIAHYDPDWLRQGNNVHYVNSLIRDYANPSEYDPWFPPFRHFDWFHGHSWAHGLQEQPDGRDQESMSEDYFSTFAQREWGRVSGQP